MSIRTREGRKSSIKAQKNLQLFFEVIILLVSVVIFIFPFLNLIAVSLSSSRAIFSGEVYFFPVEIQWNAWIGVFENKQLVNSFAFTIFLTLVYAAFGLILSILAAYPLSRKYLKGRGKLVMVFLFTMYFSGGLIPSYLLIQKLKLLDSFWVLVLPGCFSVYNMLVLKAFFQGIPDSIEEAAYIDGANDFKILLSIFIPMSKPVLATLALFFIVSRWNGFSDAIFYLPRNKSITPLQLMLRRMLEIATDEEVIRETRREMTRVKILKESQIAANILFSLIPILIAYPWLQKYFVKGVSLGAIKG